MFKQHELERITNENLKHQIIVSGREYDEEQKNLKKIEKLNDVCHLKIKDLLHEIKHMTDHFVESGVQSPKH